MYTEILLISIVGMTFSWWKFRDILHPHFVLTIIMFFMFCSDFLIRGYDDKNITAIDIEQVKSYQFIILATISAIYLSTYVLLQYFSTEKKASSKKLQRRSLLNLLIPVNQRSSHVLPLFAWTILGLEILKRLYFSSWSLSLMLVHSFGPRFHRPWASAGGNVGDEKFLFALVGILLPLAGLIFSSEVINAKNISKAAIAFIGYLTVLTLVVGAGSRTPAVLMIVLPFIYFLKKNKSKLRQIAAVGLVVGMVTLTTSVMYNTRNEGFMYSGKGISQVVYHQDDSYYRAINTIDMVAHTYDRWELTPFVGASLLNFVPRVIWPQKPTLTKEYWGKFKLHYVTITFVAELAALFGIAGGMVVAILIGIVSFFCLVALYRRIESSYDLLLYILGIVYIYMVFRSLLNITQFVYMLLFFSVMLKIDINLMGAKNRKRMRSIYR